MFIFPCKMYPISVFFVLRLYEKPQQVHSFQDFKKMFCYYYVEIIVIAGICQNLFNGHLYESYLPTKFDFLHFSISASPNSFWKLITPFDANIC